MRVRLLEVQYSVVAGTLLIAGAQVFAPNNPITLSPTTPPGAASAGVTVVNLTGSGFPTGTITPNLVTVTLAPATSGPAQSATVTGVTTVVGSTRRIVFQVLAGRPVSAPTAYLVSVRGATSTGVTF